MQEARALGGKAPQHLHCLLNVDLLQSKTIGFPAARKAGAKGLDLTET
jgi:hypothetical protein